MPTCIVHGCMTGSGKQEIKFTLAPMPKNEEFKVKWLEIINRADYLCSSQTRICHKHFKENDFIPDFENTDKRGRLKKVKKLKPIAVPSLYLSGDLHLDSGYNLMNI